MGNIIFIVWRESIEAVLVVSILAGFLRRQPGASGGLRYMWGGVAAGILASLLLALATLGVHDELSGRALDLFQAGVLILSALLMTQMVAWMKRHGRNMKKTLESEAAQAMTKSGQWGVAFVAATAIAREGAETVVYLYGLSLENAASGWMAIAGAAGLGLALALAMAWAVSRGIRSVNYALFFRITGILLLVSACGLLVNGVTRLVELDILPSGTNPLWNTSFILDAQGGIGKFLASFAGYQPRPSAMAVLVFAAYWAITTFTLRRMDARKA